MNEKNYLQDVIPPEKKRSIRDIPVPTRKKQSSRRPIQNFSNVDINVKKINRDNSSSADTDTDIDFDELNGNNYKKGKKIKTYLIVTGALIVIIGLFFVLSSLDSAVVNATPKTVLSPINKTIKIEETSKKIDQSSLGYRVLEVSKEVSKEIKANSEEYVKSSATGTITIHNEYSDKTQTLIRNTRFESPKGLIYTISTSVSVPGYKIVNGQKIAGTIDVEVTAQKAGAEYNIGLTDFTIPGFKGQEPYTLFYAKSKTEMSGGFDGVKKIVAESDLNKAKLELTDSLKTNLVSDLQNQISSDFIAVFNENSYVISPINQKNTENNQNVIISLKGTLSAKVFNKIEISNLVASNTILEFRDGQNVLINKIDTSDVSIETSVNQSTKEENISVSGNLEFIWQIDQNKFISDLKGKNKADFAEILKNHPSIARADLVIKPFWIKTFPNETKDIKINISSN